MVQIAGGTSVPPLVHSGLSFSIGRQEVPSLDRSAGTELIDRPASMIRNGAPRVDGGIGIRASWDKHKAFASEDNARTRGLSGRALLRESAAPVWPYGLFEALDTHGQRQREDQTAEEEKEVGGQEG